MWGKSMRTPLDVIYTGWYAKECEKLNVSEWTSKLMDKLESLRDFATEKSLTKSSKRKDHNDKGKIERKLSGGDEVWVWVPGKK